MNSINKNKFDAVIVRSIGFLCAVAGLILRLTEANLPGNAFAYTDVQLVFLSAIFFAALTALSVVGVVNDGGSGNSPTFSRVLHTVFVSVIVADNIAFWAISSRLVLAAEYLWSPSTLLCHIFLPVLIVVDWILFLPHGAFEIRHAPLSLVLPAISYAVLLMFSSNEYVFFEGQFGAYYRRIYYPYYFLQPNIMGGTGAVLGIAALFAAGFLFVSFAFVLIDFLLGGKKKKNIRFYDKKQEKRK